MGKKKREPDKLSQDAAAAKAAGLSYGRWKALQEEKPVVKHIPAGWGICPTCGQPFMKKKNQMYCDSVCQQKAWEKNHREHLTEYHRQWKKEKEYCEDGREGQKVPVLQYDKDMNLIARYESVKAASEAMYRDQSSIVKCCKGKMKTVAGYVWRYEKDESKT